MKRAMLFCIVGMLFMGTNLYAADGDLIVNGNVGIGMNPAMKLDVAGDIRTTNSGDSALISNSTGNLASTAIMVRFNRSGG